MRLTVRYGWMVVGLALGPAVGACGGEGGTAPPGVGEIRVTVSRDGGNAAGVTVHLFGTGGSSPLTSATTGTAGTAVFGNLTPGGYEVEVVVPVGAQVTGGSARRGVTVGEGATVTATFQLATAASAEVVEVRLTSSATFSPADLTIQAGQTVRWVNDVAMLHTVTPQGHSAWTEATLSAAGAQFEHRFTSPGTFSYVCVPHASAGMTGVIRVQ
jgi:plastocyanin